ncbi:hypothetical protein Pla123a_01450 [Posidoniimonas polymericola]|uniref:Uncharacterized protein n=1 Tax=Posidoniimonas polymericola TaxID=2528002 RepID=A0A5C5ZDU1_9BACT|nr:hypothetical protein [Posidoniimonas polymericola]TWT85338.1 hypothetical protein Pla123a_01450 [Posidoniimonas polymericola]
MQVGLAGEGLMQQQSMQRRRDHEVQAVFSDILEAAGRQGYASAPDSTQDGPLGASATDAWEHWFDSQRVGGRYASVEKASELRSGYSELIARAHAEGGYQTPQEFLGSLTREELSVVQRVHALADPIGVDALTEEGVLNLLLPPVAQVDLNHDGITRSGIGSGLRFPDSNTPPDVAAAWEEATAGMPLGERMTFELQMLMPLLTANIHLNPDGSYSHTSEPGDPDWQNPFADPGYSYAKATQDQLDHLDFSRPFISEDQYERGVAFWSRLKALLEV